MKLVRVALIVLATSLSLPSGAVASQAIVHKPAHLQTPLDQGTAYSTNWSGYADYNATFSDVKGSWTQPAVSCPSRQHQYSSFWVGIDGYNSNSVEQIGTDSDCVGRRRASYYAWFEMYPAGSVVISGFRVSPGDHLSAEVSAAGTTYTLTLTNVTTGVQFTTTQSTVATQSSAEWVAEAPSSCFFTCSVLPLANFATVNFTGSYTTSNGTTGSIGAFTNDQVVMVTNGGTVKAQPSPLSPDGTAFSDTWQHS